MSIDRLGELRRIMNMNVNETYDPATDSLEALAAAVAAIIILLGGGGTQETSMTETWQDELGIDFTIWTYINPATGAGWARGAGAGVMAAFLAASAAPNANETARLRSNQRWQAIPTLIVNDNTITKRLRFEFEMTIANLANLDNTICFFGLTPGVADNRATNDIIGFALIGAGNALQTVTDVGGVEEVNTGFGENLAQVNKFRIDVYEDNVNFYLNEVLIATHVVSLPDQAMYLNFFFDTTAGGAATPQIGITRAILDDSPPA